MDLKPGSETPLPSPSSPLSAQGLVAATKPTQRLINTHNTPLPPLKHPHPWRGERALLAGKRSDAQVPGIGTRKRNGKT